MEAVAVVSSMTAVTAPGQRQLAGFRRGWYGCLGRWADVLFELTDAVLCSGGPVTSLPRLSLEPVMGRGHGSGYAALADGQVDEARLEGLLARFAPGSWPLVFAVDATTWPRAAAGTSPGRGLCYQPSRAGCGPPVVAGWGWQLVARLNFDRDSWTWPMSWRWLDPRQDAAAATIGQVRQVAGRLDAAGPVPWFCFDAGSAYDPATLTHGLAGQRAQLLIRLRKNRRFLTDPPPRRPGQTGRPRRHGHCFDLKDEATWGAPDTRYRVTDPVYGQVAVQAWAGLHPRITRAPRWAGHGQLPIVRGWVIRVQVSQLPKPGPARASVLWLWWAGPPGLAPDLDTAWRAYVHRFDIEHTIRFTKQTLGWTVPAVRTPAQATRWTAIITAALAQLVLARPVAADHRLPWERPRPAHRLTPGRIRRDFHRVRSALPVIANPRKPCRAGPGRPRGPARTRAKQHPVIRKNTPQPAKR
jgi:hypothetical protein